MEHADIFLATAIFGNADLTKTLDAENPGLDAELLPADPLTTFLEASAFELALHKSGGPLTSDASWDAPLYPSRVSLSPDFLKRSSARIAKACEAVDRVMGDSEFAEQARALVKEMFEQERAAVLGA